MASELRVQFSLTASKNGASINFPHTKANDMTGDVIYQNIQTIGTTTEQIVLSSDISGTPGMMALKNLDATNYIEIGLDTPVTQIFAKLLAGQGMIFPPGTATLYAKANTAACKLFVAATSA